MNLPVPTSEPLTPGKTLPLSTRWQTLIRALWLLIVLYTVTIVVAAILPRYTYLATTGLAADARVLGALSDAEIAALEGLGLSTEFYAAYITFFEVISLPVFIFVSAVILWRGRWTYPQILTAFIAIPMGTVGSPLLETLWRTQPLFYTPALILQAYGLICFILLLFLFPDGHFQPRFARWLSVVIALYVLSWFVFPVMRPTISLLVRSPDQIATLAMLLLLLCIGVAAQVYRYMRVSTPVERQQTRWLVFGTLLFSVIAIIFAIPILFIPSVSALTPLGMAYRLVAITLLLGANLIIGITLGIATLRYRLYEVDLAINRSLVYGSVTLLLVAGIFAVVFLVQVLLGGTQTPLALIFALIGAGLAFNPLRRRVQQIVDKRFYGLRFGLDDVRAKPLEIKNPGAWTGHTLDGYQLLGVLGKGGMGEVYTAQKDGQIAAVKILPGDLAQQEDFRKRFEREAATLAALDHPHIVKLYASGVAEGVYYLAMEYIEGRDLSSVLKERAKLAWHEVRPPLVQLAAALDYAHMHGIIHRDLKPSNIVLRADTDEAILMDFGVAKMQDARTSITGTGAIGTIDYMAPEQIVSAQQVDKRADVYALAVVAYEMLSGERPFKGSAAQVLFAHLQQPAPDLHVMMPDLPRKVAKGIQKALSKQPTDRFNSAGEFVGALG